MTREDIRGRRAPAWLASMIVRRFGRTPFGEARYRLVWAPARFERSGGTWTDWDESVAASARERGAAAPRRRAIEMRWVPKYPGETCWLIEKWQPGSSYGTPARWYSPTWAGGTVLATEAGPIASLGDYPFFGDYEDIGARMHWYPTERHVTVAIGAVESGIERLPSTPLGRALRRTWLARQEQDRRDREFDALAAAVFDDAAPAFGGAPMVGFGGSHRPALVEMAERIGIRQHPM